MIAAHPIGYVSERVAVEAAFSVGMTYGFNDYPASTIDVSANCRRITARWWHCDVELRSRDYPTVRIITAVRARHVNGKWRLRVTQQPTRHQAKLATFKTLLRITEQRPDVTDATHAAITVGRCIRVTGGWRCDGSLSPVLQSGIPIQLCYRVTVKETTTKITEVACSNT